VSVTDPAGHGPPPATPLPPATRNAATAVAAPAAGPPAVPAISLAAAAPGAAAAGVTAAVPAVPGLFYDQRRRVHYAKPVMRGWLHLLWFAASVAASAVLLASAHGAAALAALGGYAASTSALFGTSAVYHCGTWNEVWRARLQRLDHAMIFFFIAGTATPVFVLAVRGGPGMAGLIALWALTLTAASIHMVWMNAPERLVGGTFLALGWVAAMALPAVWLRAGPLPGALMLGGGLLYTAGALCYHWRRPDPVPSVFGYHEVFHAFVCAAATCQYVAITLLAR
jgi:hemolysin III